MSEIIFTEENQQAPRQIPGRSYGGLTAWLVTKGIARSESQAIRIMLGTVIAAVIIAVLAPIIFGGDGSTLSPEEQAKIRQSTPRPPLR